jgi:hypothetical protein
LALRITLRPDAALRPILAGTPRFQPDVVGRNLNDVAKPSAR